MLEQVTFELWDINYSRVVGLGKNTFILPKKGSSSPGIRMRYFITKLTKYMPQVYNILNVKMYTTFTV